MIFLGKIEVPESSQLQAAPSGLSRLSMEAGSCFQSATSLPIRRACGGRVSYLVLLWMYGGFWHTGGAIRQAPVALMYRYFFTATCATWTAHVAGQPLVVDGGTWVVEDKGK